LRSADDEAACCLLLCYCCCAGLTRDNWSYIAYALTALTVIIFLFTMVMLRRIQVAVACIKVRRSWQLPSALPGCICASCMRAAQQDQQD
jgi:hypothetical protein